MKKIIQKILNFIKINNRKIKLIQLFNNTVLFFLFFITLILLILKLVSKELPSINISDLILILTFTAIIWTSRETVLLRMEQQKSSRAYLMPKIVTKKINGLPGAGFSYLNIENLGNRVAYEVDIRFINKQGARLFNDQDTLLLLKANLGRDGDYGKEIIDFFDSQEIFQKTNIGPNKVEIIKFQDRENKFSRVNDMNLLFDIMVIKQIHFRYKIVIKYNTFTEIWERNSDYANGFRRIVGRDSSQV